MPMQMASTKLYHGLRHGVCQFAVERRDSQNHQKQFVAKSRLFGIGATLTIITDLYSLCNPAARHALILGKNNDY